MSHHTMTFSANWEFRTHFIVFLIDNNTCELGFWALIFQHWPPNRKGNWWVVSMWNFPELTKISKNLKFLASTKLSRSEKVLSLKYYVKMHGIHTWHVNLDKHDKFSTYLCYPLKWNCTDLLLCSVIKSEMIVNKTFKHPISWILHRFLRNTMVYIIFPKIFVDYLILACRFIIETC